MKLLNALLATAVLLSACQAEQDGELQISGSKSDFSQTTVSNSTNGVAFPEPDASVAFGSNTAQAVWQILQKVDPKQATVMGETQISDAQYAEIKTFVDANLKDETDYKTYLNIFQWIVKNVTYAGNGDAYLAPYDVFKYKRCICQGYANLLKTMCLTQGIPCFVANGWLSTIGGHAWNYVYAGGDWYVSDPTNDHYYKAANVDAYKNELIPLRMDFSLFEDDACVYNFLNGALNVSEVKNTDASVVTIPYSINGLRVTSFQPNVKLPENVSTLIIGANISTFGDSPSSLNWACGNLEEVVVDPRNNDFDSYKGVVYLRANDAYPYFIPAGIRRIELRPMKVMDKNVITMLDKLEEIVIADGTERVEDYAVENCPNLKRVYVPSSVTYISSDAFSKCGNYEIIRTTTGIHNVRL